MAHYSMLGTRWSRCRGKTWSPVCEGLVTLLHVRPEVQIEALPRQPVEMLHRQELGAPISGLVAERRVGLGSLVGREGLKSELFVIVDPSGVWVYLAISPSDLAPPAKVSGSRSPVSASKMRGSLK